MYARLPAEIPPWVPLCAAFWLLANTWLGWQRGPVRQAASLLGLALGSAAGFWLGPAIAPVVPTFGFPQFLRPVFGGCLLGLAVWGAISILSSIVFRRTGEQGWGMIRMVYGLSGAALGLLSGLVVLGVGAIAVRSAGSFADGVQKADHPNTRGNPRPRAATDDHPLSILKKAIEDSPAAPVLNALDPLPGNLYARLEKAGEVFASPSAKLRLMSDPAMSGIAKNPKLIALMNDGPLQEALRSGDLAAILRNPKVQAAASDTQLLTLLRTMDLDAILEKATAEPISGGLPQKGGHPSNPSVAKPIRVQSPNAKP